MAVRNARLEEMFLSDSRIMMQTLRRVVQEARSGELTSEQVDRAFRAAHSLKSEAGFLELNEISTTAHELESILSGVRDAGGVLDSSNHERLMKALSILDAKLDMYYSSVSGKSEDAARGTRRSEVEEDAESSDPLMARPSNYQAEDATLESALRTSGVRAMLRESNQRGERFFRLEVRILSHRDLLYPRAFLIINNLEVSAVVIATEPAVEELSDDQRQLRLIVATSQSDEQVRSRVHVDEVEVTELTEVSFDELFEQPTEGQLESQPAYDQKDEPDTLRAELHVVADHLDLEAKRLADVVGEQAAAREGLQRIERLAAYLRGRSTGRADVQLLDAARKIQQQAVQYAARQGKRIRLTFGGTGALVSSVVSNVVVDALLHLIRNSIDHGILPLQERVRSGRPPAGSIRVEVHARGDLVRLRVADDGVGVDERAARAAAGVGGDVDLVQILTRPGFTSKAEPTEGSGRGVGLDAVLHTTKRLLRGALSLRNKPGSGLSVTMSFPRRAELLPVMLVMHGRANFAIPTSVLLGRESLTVDLVKRDSFGSTYYQIEAHTIPVLTPSGRTPRLERFDNSAQLLLVRGMRGRLALAVDSVIGEETVVKDSQSANMVYSRLLDGDAQLLLPGLLID